MNGVALLKRKEIIEIWQAQSEKFLNSYCCPNCRDLMDEDETDYYCANEQCDKYMFRYNKKEVAKCEL